MKIGDIVYLQSGSPDMTITEIEKEGGATYCVCRWFTDQGVLQQESFPEAALTVRPREDSEQVSQPSAVGLEHN